MQSTCVDRTSRAASVAELKSVPTQSTQLTNRTLPTGGINARGQDVNSNRHNYIGTVDLRDSN